MSDHDQVARFQKIEREMVEQSDWREGKPVALFYEENSPPDHRFVRALLAWLVERGWLITLDEGGLLAWPPHPLRDPGDVSRNLN